VKKFINRRGDLGEGVGNDEALKLVFKCRYENKFGGQNLYKEGKM
jgi:hypothetical protein